MAATPEAPEAADPSGDLLDSNGNTVDGPPYMDILEVSATRDGDELRVRIGLAGNPPIVDPFLMEVTFGFFIDTNGDGQAEYQTLATNIEGEGSFSGSLSLLSDGSTQRGSEFPGLVVVGGELALIQIPLSAIGQPDEIQIAAFSEWISFPEPETDPTRFEMVTDAVPDIIVPDSAAEWITVQ